MFFFMKLLRGAYNYSNKELFCTIAIAYNTTTTEMFKHRRKNQKLCKLYFLILCLQLICFCFLQTLALLRITSKLSWLSSFLLSYLLSAAVHENLLHPTRAVCISSSNNRNNKHSTNSDDCDASHHFTSHFTSFTQRK